MKQEFISLFFIALVAACTPLIARLIPRRMLPETVIMLLAGALLGPHMAGVIQTSEIMDMFSDLGVGFLFLLAGYEIDTKHLTDKDGKRGLITWLASFVLSFGCAIMLCIYTGNKSPMGFIAMAIALCTTALGTLIPILKERNLNDTPVGNAILSYGTWGELCPVIAIALLLSSRAEWKTILILIAFILVCVVLAVVPAKAKKAGHVIYQVLETKRKTTSQSMVRVTILLLIGLLTLSETLGLDIVLGSFAAGFILRYIVPEGDEDLEIKLNGIGYGFFIPLFFIVSGAKIDLAAVGAMPTLLVAFILILLEIRAIPIIVALSMDKEEECLSIHHRFSVALYCTTALPVVVAVSSIAVNAGAMTQNVASVLVAASAITVFIMPLLGSIAYSLIDFKPFEAINEIMHRPRDMKAILKEHAELERLLKLQDQRNQAKARKLGLIKGEPSWVDTAYKMQKQNEEKQKLLNRLDEVKQELAAKDSSTEHAITKRALKIHEKLAHEVGREHLKTNE